MEQLQSLAGELCLKNLNQEGVKKMSLFKTAKKYQKESEQSMKVFEKLKKHEVTFSEARSERSVTRC